MKHTGKKHWKIFGHFANKNCHEFSHDFFLGYVCAKFQIVC